MKKTYRFYMVDDDPITIQVMTRILTKQNHTVFSSLSSSEAVAEILRLKPDCILLDIMMPEMDGIQLCHQLRKHKSLAKAKIVMVTSKFFESDRERAHNAGADGYILKPVDPDRLADQLVRIIEDGIELTFWGVRGTLPVPGKRAVRYGGNTNCVSLSFSKGQLFIFDAGTGIKELSDHLMRENPKMFNAKIFISHPHWDHINALPFFAPLYMHGNNFEICGPSQSQISIGDILSGQMDGIHFPIQIKEFGANIQFRDLTEGPIDTDGIEVRAMLLNHPGHCLGYRVQYKTRSVCYITDNELLPESSPHYDANYVEKLTRFVYKTDALITDATYTDEEYEGKMFWGHSSLSRVAALADNARVKQLFLIHHDPDQTDKDIDAKLKLTRAALRRMKSPVRCIAPREKQVFVL
ncbi:MAG: response regulator [Desulfobacterales bacterium]|nr:response regulator [Desulfobacterales bacterium]